MLSTLKPLLINSGIIAGLTITPIELGLKIILLLITIGYTVWHWYREWKKSKTEDFIQK
jgi:hypothetical protein